MQTQHHTQHVIGRWMSDRAHATPRRVAVVDRGVPTTYAELETRAHKLAQKFQSAGYQVGDRVATLTGNTVDHVVVFFACAKAGLVMVPLSWRLTPRELAANIETAAPALLLAEGEHQALADAAVHYLPSKPARAALGEHGVELTTPPPATVLIQDTFPLVPSTHVHDDSGLLMLFTSGTEGQPKAVVLTHANCFWNNLALSRTVELTGTDTVLSVLPQFHAGGWNIQPLLAWWAGATVILERSFDAGRALRLIAEHRITSMMGVPSHYLALAEHSDFQRADLSSLRSAVVGGAPMPPALIRLWHERGVSLVQGYGLTEAGPNVLCVVPEDAREKVGYAGRAYPHVDVAIADPVTGEHLAGPGRGELLVSGPSVFAGYFRNRAATEAAFANGWLRTGDLVEVDADGDIRIVDRIKDIFISGGENVSPAEVEHVLLSHPAVAEAAVVGIPDARWGEVGRAFIVKRPGIVTDGVELREFCRERLAGFKVPVGFEFVASLPKSGLSKISRARLRSAPNFEYDAAATEGGQR